MRLWSKYLTKYIMRQQLLSQWRECCCIAKNLATNGTPNHLLVNKILDYPLNHFTSYTQDIIEEMRSRGYKISNTALSNYNKNMEEASIKLDDYSIYNLIPTELIYEEWHDTTYLVICLYNLYEKCLCGGIATQEWDKIYHKFYKYIDFQ